MRQRITPWPCSDHPGMTSIAMQGAGGLVDLKLGHYTTDGIEVIDVAGTIDISTARRLRELLIDLVSTDNCQLIVNLDQVEFLDSTGLGVLVGGLKRVRAHDGSLDLVCTQERILKIFRITGLTKVFGIHETVDQAIAAQAAPVRNVSPGATQPRASGLSAARSHPGDSGRNGAGPVCWTRRLCNAFSDNHRADPARSGPPLVIMSRIVRFSTAPCRATQGAAC